MIHVKLNDRGKSVTIIQSLLNTALYSQLPLNPDGHFGQKTERAVRIFQKQFGLEPDGVVGPTTLAALGLVAGYTFKTVQPVTGKSWIDIAEAELGIKENASPGKHRSRILEYHATTTLKATSDETPWCSSFVNWVVIQSGKKGTNNALARSWLDWGKEVKAVKGCIIVIKKKTAGFTNETGSTTGFHVGFFISQSPSHIKILGGNQSDSVKYSSFKLSAYDIKGCRE